MKTDKFGDFVRELRKEKNMNQQELADLIPIGREAVSKWERGKSIPDYSSMIRLSEIFDLTINELLFGEKKNSININQVEKISIDLYKNIFNKKKIIKYLIGIIGILLGLFLLYYFYINYNSIMVYELYYNNSNINITQGLVLKTTDKVYFNLGNITSSNKIKNIRIYYKNSKNEEKFIVSTNSLNISFADTLGYEEFFDINQMDYILNNLYLDITYEELSITVKLNAEKIYSNNNFFPLKVLKN